MGKSLLNYIKNTFNQCKIWFLEFLTGYIFLKIKLINESERKDLINVVLNINLFLAIYITYFGKTITDPTFHIPFSNDTTNDTITFSFFLAASYGIAIAYIIIVYAFLSFYPLLKRYGKTTDNVLYIVNSSLMLILITTTVTIFAYVLYSFISIYMKSYTSYSLNFIFICTVLNLIIPIILTPFVAAPIFAPSYDKRKKLIDEKGGNLSKKIIIETNSVKTQRKLLGKAFNKWNNKEILDINFETVLQETQIKIEVSNLKIEENKRMIGQLNNERKKIEEDAELSKIEFDAKNNI
jgi:hypothetical protein